MEHVAPVFFKHTQVFQNITKGKRENNILTPLEVCLSACNVVDRQAIAGAQKIRNLWRVYTKNMDIRANLLLKGLTLRKTKVGLFNKNPYSNNTHDVDNQPELVQITIKYIPLSYHNDEIKDFLTSTYPHLVLQTDITDACERSGRKLTRFLNGDRFVKAVGPINPPLDRKVKIGIWNARLFHDGQETVIKCQICNKAGHKPGSPDCEATVPDMHLTTVSGPGNILSNFHPTPVPFRGKLWPTAEHAYVNAKAADNNMQEEADSVMDIGHAGLAKKLSRELDKNISPEWEPFSLSVIEEILTSKFQNSPEFRAALAETGHNMIAHTVMDRYWGTGLSPELTSCVDPSRWPGENQFGKLLMKLREIQIIFPAQCPSPHQDDPMSEKTPDSEDGLTETEELQNTSAPSQNTATDEQKDIPSRIPVFNFRPSSLTPMVGGNKSGRVRRATSTPPSTDRWAKHQISEDPSDPNTPIKMDGKIPSIPGTQADQSVT